MNGEINWEKRGWIYTTQECSFLRSFILRMFAGIQGCLGIDGQSWKIIAKRDQVDTTAGDTFDVRVKQRSVQRSVQISCAAVRRFERLRATWFVLLSLRRRVRRWGGRW